MLYKLNSFVSTVPCRVSYWTVTHHRVWAPKYTIVKYMSVLAGLCFRVAHWMSTSNKAAIGQPFTLGLVQTGISTTTIHYNTGGEGGYFASLNFVIFSLFGGTVEWLSVVSGGGGSGGGGQAVLVLLIVRTEWSVISWALAWPAPPVSLSVS